MAEYLIFFNQQWVGDHPEEWLRGRAAGGAPVQATWDQSRLTRIGSSKAMVTGCSRAGPGAV